MFFHRETSSLKMNKLNVIIWVWLFACSHHATTCHNICYMKPARQLLTCNMLWMRYPGCSTQHQTHLLCRRATLAALLHLSPSQEISYGNACGKSTHVPWHLNEIIFLSDNPVFTQQRCIWGRKLSRNFPNPKP